jgi:hypothetical protein
MTNVNTNTLPRKGQTLFCKRHSDSTIRFSETDIINMLDFLIENMFAKGTSSIYRNVKLKYWASFFSFFLTIHYMMSDLYE